MKKIGSRKWKSEYIYYKKKEGHYNHMWKTGHVDCHIAERYFASTVKVMKMHYKHWSIHQVYEFPTRNYSNPWDFDNGIRPIIRRSLVNSLILCCLNTIYGYEQLHMARVFSIVFTQIL